MKHIKLFEGYLEDKVEKFLDDIKSEVDQYMYYILDDVQTDSSTDGMYLTGKNKIFILYNKISIDLMKEENKNKLLKLSKVIEKEFEMKITIFECSGSIIHNDTETDAKGFIIRYAVRNEHTLLPTTTSFTIKLM